MQQGQCLSDEPNATTTQSSTVRTHGRNTMCCGAMLQSPSPHVTAGERPTLPRHAAAVNCGRMADVALDTQERLALCDLLDELGPSVPTLLEGWTAHDLAAHIVLRERDLVAGPCLVLPSRFQRFAERRRFRLAQRREFAWLVARIRSGPPLGLFRVGWVRSLANLNEFFVHHEDVRRANRRGPRSLTPAMDAALWRNVRRGSRYLCRRLHACGLEIEWAGADQRVTASTRRADGCDSAVRRANFCSTSLGARMQRRSRCADHRRPLRRCVARTSACESIAGFDPQVSAISRWSLLAGSRCNSRGGVHSVLVRREVGSAVNCPTRERLPVSASSALPSRTTSDFAFRIDRVTKRFGSCCRARMVLTCMPRTSPRTSRWSASTPALLTLRAYLPSIGCRHRRHRLRGQAVCGTARLAGGAVHRAALRAGRSRAGRGAQRLGGRPCRARSWAARRFVMCCPST